MLRRLFEDSQDLVLLEVAALALGHLVRSGGPMMADVVERQVGGARGVCMRRAGGGCEEGCGDGVLLLGGRGRFERACRC